MFFVTFFRVTHFFILIVQFKYWNNDGKRKRNTKMLSERKKCFIQKLYDVESGTQYFCLFDLAMVFKRSVMVISNLNNTRNHSRKYVFHLYKYMYWSGCTSFRIPLKINFPSSNYHDYFIIMYEGRDNVSHWFDLTQL